MRMHRILCEEDAQVILQEVQRAQWDTGKARTPELTGTVKQNQEILGKALPERSHLIAHRLVNNSGVQLNHVPLKIHPPKFSKYSDGAHYKVHTDAPWMAETRTDLSCTLWLSDPDSYEGGELCLNGQQIKGRPGECLIYDCGSPHSVNPVTKGDRVCAVTWIQSRIRDPHKRKLVSDFRKLLSKFEKDHPDWFVEGGQIHSALIRMWME